MKMSQPTELIIRFMYPCRCGEILFGTVSGKPEIADALQAKVDEFVANFKLHHRGKGHRPVGEAEALIVQIHRLRNGGQQDNRHFTGRNRPPDLFWIDR